MKQVERNMASVRVLILRAPGTNCDEETSHAFRLAGGMPVPVHLNRLLEAPRALDEFQILCIPGGFSYGDDLAAGKVLATLLQLRLGDALRGFRDHDRLILGTCNGFQALLKSGLLVEPDAKTGRARATLTLNRHGRFEDRWVHLKLTPGRCAFIPNEAIVTMPIAHGEGNFVVTDPALLGELDACGRINARYVDAAGNAGEFPINPNGSMGDVAGISDATGRVFALMPHPERHVWAYQHPRWTRRREQPAEGDGMGIFRAAVGYFK
jgi:phosphoribosylformylglycinamidine synthase